jgi:hypothetical protein
VVEVGMSWQATAWAMRQTTGAARRKLLLLALATYADPNGVCWPSQETLARDTEQSVDSVQRQLDVLEKIKLLDRSRMPKRRGQWQGHRYQLPLQTDRPPKGQNAARSRDLRPGQTAKPTPTRPHSLRLKPSIEPSYEPSHLNRTTDSEERLLAFQRKQEGSEIVQNRIARRIGNDGWVVLGEMSDAQRACLTTLERQGCLDNETLTNALLQSRLARRQ